MNQLKKSLLALAASLLLAVPAMAQGVAFQSTSLPRQVRVEGRTDVVGEINLLASNTGTIPVGSSITIVYAAEITNTIGAANVTCVEDAVPTSCAGDIAVTTTGNQLTISITTAITFVVSAGRITISGVRVDVSALGAGSTVLNAILSGTSAAPGTNPITFTSPNVQVGTIQPRALDGRFPSTPGTVLTCNAQAVTGSTLVTQLTFTVRVDELFPAAATSLADENGFFADATNGTKIRITLNGVPTGYTITPLAPAAQGAIPLLTLSTPGQKKSTGSPLTFDYTVGGAAVATLTGSVEAANLGFNVRVAGGDAQTLGGATAVVTAAISLEDVDTGSSPQIISFNTNIQEENTVFNVADCLSYLLFPWTVYTGDGALDTGFAISNTTADPAVIGTAAQTGDVTLYFFRDTGASNPAPVTIASDLEAGQTATYILSTLGAEFQGYVIAVCNFQLAHGFAFINNPGGFASGSAFAESYLALSLTNPRPAVTESSGH